MKRILLALSVLGLFLPAIPQAEARTDVSIDFFYNNLGNDGSWTEIGDYGYGWQPSVAVSNRNWRPYSDGYWAYTDVGWTWISYEDFGWATYHYGRWTRLRDRGWFWIPGREWAPAWVSWRTGGDYVGWAPLPPRGGREVVYEGRPVNGQVDLDYDIGPASYNFIDVRFIGEPLLRERIFDSGQNYGYVNRTVNVTNITYNNSTVYNYGPDYNTLSAYSTRPIQRLSLQRDTNVDFVTAAQSGALTKVQGDKLIVAAPQTFQKAATLVAPKVVKEKIAQPNVEHGWATSDENSVAQLKQKMKSEDAKNIPPPDIKPKAGNAAALTAVTPPATAASPATPANPSASISPAIAASPGTVPAQPGQGKGKNKRGEVANPNPATAPTPTDPNAPAAVAATPKTAGASADKGKGKGKDKRAENAPPFASPPPAPDGSGPESVATPVPVQEKGDKNKGKRGETAPKPVAPLDTATPKTAGVSADKGKGKGKDQRAEKAPPFASPIPAPEGSAVESVATPAPVQEKGGKSKGKRGETAPKPVAPPDTSVAPGQSDAVRVAPEAAAPEKKHKGQRERALEPATPPTAAAPEAAPGEPRGKRNRDLVPEDRGAPAAPEGQPRPRKEQPVMQERAPAPEAAGQDGEHRQGKGEKRKKGEPEPAAASPTP